MKTLDIWRTEDPCDGVQKLSASLPNGIWLNLIVDRIDRSLRFLTSVLGADVKYSDDSFAIVGFADTFLMLHAKETYGAHPLHVHLPKAGTLTPSIEIRLQGVMPDAAEGEARTGGFEILQSAIDTEHGLREVHIIGPDGHIWVPCIPSDIK